MDSVWMMSTGTGIVSVPANEVVKRETEGWKKCDPAGNVQKPAILPKKKKESK